MSNQFFLSLCDDFIEKNSLSWKQRDYLDSKISSFYSLHWELIKELLMCGYSIADICFREVDLKALWNGIPRTDLYIPPEDIVFTESNELRLIIRLSLPRLSGTEKLSDTRYLMIEFSEK